MSCSVACPEETGRQVGKSGEGRGGEGREERGDGGEGGERGEGVLTPSYSCNTYNQQLCY